MFLCDFPQARAGFVSLQTLTDHDVLRIARRIRMRVRRLLNKRGKLSDSDASDPDAEPSTLEVRGAAAVQGKVSLGLGSGARDARERACAEAWARPRNQLRIS